MWALAAGATVATLSQGVTRAAPAGRPEEPPPGGLKKQGAEMHAAAQARKGPVKAAIGAVRASGFLTGGRQTYPPTNLTDGALETAWCVRTPAGGVGDWFEVDLDRPAWVSRIRLTNGFVKRHAKLGDLYLLNNRVTQARLAFDGAPGRAVALREIAGWQDLDIEPPVQARAVRLTIGEFLPGSRWNDTCLSEVEIWVAPGL